MIAILATDGWTYAESAVFRSVCARWASLHDAHLTSLRLSDAGFKARRFWGGADQFPCLQAMEVHKGRTLTDEDLSRGVAAMAGKQGLRRLTLTMCPEVTDKGLQALADLPELESLALEGARRNAHRVAGAERCASRVGCALDGNKQVGLAGHGRETITNLEMLCVRLRVGRSTSVRAGPFELCRRTQNTWYGC